MRTRKNRASAVSSRLIRESVQNKFDELEELGPRRRGIQPTSSTGEESAEGSTESPGVLAPATTPKQRAARGSAHHSSQGPADYRGPVHRAWPWPVFTPFITDSDCI